MFQRLTIGIIVFVFFWGCNKKQHEGIAIIVNGHEISSAEVQQTAEMIRESMIAAFPEKAVEGVTSDLMAGAAQQLIANRLFHEEARKRGITVDSATVDSAYEALKKRAPNQAAFERELIRMGETDSSLRLQITDGLRIEALMKVILADIPSVDSQKCMAFYEKNKEKYIGTARIRASQIFFPFKDSITDGEKKKIHTQASEVRQKIKSGTGFSECAKKYSRGPGASDGGDIGWFKKGDLRPDLENPLFALNKDEVSDVIVTDNGLFLLKKTDQEEASQLPFEEVQKHIRFLLEVQERNKVISQHLNGLITDAKITYIDTTLAKEPSMKDLSSLPEMAPEALQ